MSLTAHHPLGQSSTCTKDDVSMEHFKRTSLSLKNLQDALSCHSCIHRLDQIMETRDLYSLGVCEHRFCKSCVDEMKKTCCPLCLQPFKQANVHLDKQLSNIALLCTRFTNILEGKPDESLEDEERSNENSTDVGRIKPRFDSTKLSDWSLKNEDAEDVAVSKKMSSSNLSGPTTPLKQDLTLVKARRHSTPRSKTSAEIRKPVRSAEKDHQLTLKIDKEHKDKLPVMSSAPRRLVVSDVQSISKKKKGTKDLEKKDVHGLIGDDVNSVVTSCESEATPVRKRKHKHMADIQTESSPSAGASTTSSAEKGKHSTPRRNNVSLEKRNVKGETRLQVAALKADLALVEELLTKGANPNVKDHAGWTPLHEAVNHGNTRIAEILLDHGASINAPGLENDTPLHDAVNNYRLDCVNLLIRRGASVTVRNMHGQTPLDVAKTKEMTEALLEADQVNCDETVNQDQTFSTESASGHTKFCFVTSALAKEDISAAQKCAKLLDAKLLDSQSCDALTHCISGVNAAKLVPRTVKYFTAILSGAWIVSSEWVNECLQQQKHVAEDKYEAQGCVTTGICDALQRARVNRMKQLPGLFDGCQFYFLGKFKFPSLSREELTTLAKLGGGAILTREPRLHSLDDYPYTIPYHAATNSSLSDCAVFVIYDDKCPNPPHVSASRMTYLPASWFLDSVALFKLLEKTDYLKQ